MNKMTSFLFATPSFADGLARTLDMAGDFDVYNESSTPDAADARALWSDWCAVGEDMKEVFGKMKQDMDDSISDTTRK
jgi:hypothetical protein